MFVPQPRERTAHHLVHETVGRIHLNDAGDECLPHAEVAPLERHEIAELQQPLGTTRRKQPLAGKCGGLDVRADVARQVEAALDGNGDYGFDDDLTHESFSVAVRLKISRSAVESGSTQK